MTEVTNVILYEDDLFVIADKPAGIPVHETKDPTRPDFTRSLLYRYGYKELRTVNRLDLGTSGIVVFGKDSERNKEIDTILSGSEKEYIFIGHRKPEWIETRFDCFLKDGNKKVTIVRSGGKKAITLFKVLETHPNKPLFLAKAKLQTGRRHQIRISISELGYPILGDLVYGDEKQKAKRMFLHSYLLRFKKFDGSEVEILCRPPVEFYELFPNLDSYL